MGSVPALLDGAAFKGMLGYTNALLTKAGVLGEWALRGIPAAPLLQYCWQV